MSWKKIRVNFRNIFEQNFYTDQIFNIDCTRLD